MRKFRYQSGFVITSMFLGMAVIAALLIAGFSYSISQRGDALLEKDKEEYLHEVGKMTEDWYRRNAWEIDSVSEPILESVIVQKAGINQQYGLRIVSSKRLTLHNVQYHVFALWIPNQSIQGTALDLDSGLFTEGIYANNQVERLKFHILNGNVIETDIYQQTSTTLRLIASKLEVWFTGKAVIADIDSSVNNWFREPVCGTGDQAFLPCIDSFEEAAPYLTEIGISTGSDTLSGWGQPITMSNLLNSSNTYPFSMALSAYTPWGESIIRLAVQTSSNTY